jgi:hypothetical protein
MTPAGLLYLTAVTAWALYHTIRCKRLTERNQSLTALADNALAMLHDERARRLGADDAALDWAIHGPTPEEYWGREETP